VSAGFGPLSLPPHRLWRTSDETSRHYALSAIAFDASCERGLDTAVPGQLIATRSFALIGNITLSQSLPLRVLHRAAYLFRSLRQRLSILLLYCCSEASFGCSDLGCVGHAT
jgi:hypothetical protein